MKKETIKNCFLKTNMILAFGGALLLGANNTFAQDSKTQDAGYEESSIDWDNMNCREIADRYKVKDEATVNKEIAGVLDEYFSIRLDSMTNVNPVNSKILSSSVQSKESQRRAVIEKNNKRAYMDILDATNKIALTSVNQKDDVIDVDLKEWIFFDYDNTDTPIVTSDASSVGVEHEITIRKTDSGYVIVNDDAKDDFGFYEDSLYESGKSNVKEESTELSSSTKTVDLSVSTKKSYTYNVDAAVAYADKYCTSYNPAYASFASVGGDCANFVSQCLVAGGLPQTVGSHGAISGCWYYKSASDRSGTWTTARYLCSYLEAEFGTKIKNPTASQLYKGNPVFYHNSGTGYDDGHATICVGYGSDGTPLIDAHTSDRYRVKFSFLGTPKSTILLDGTEPKPVGHNPEGTLDEVKGGDGTIYVRGWAFDRDNREARLQIHVYVGGAYDSGAPGYAIIADTYRPDVDSAYSGFGKYHGFDSTIEVGVTGTKTLYVYAINVGDGSNTLIATKDVTINAKKVVEPTVSDTTAPVISDVKYSNVTSSGYTVTCTVTDDMSGVAKVQFPTWIGTNPYENDGSWMTSAKCAGTISGNTVTYRVNTSDYGNKTGTYNTHIYAWDNSGNMAGAYQLKIKVPAYPAKSITVSTSGRVYTGNACKPAITVKDTAGNIISPSNYTVSYSNNVNVGTATVKATFDGKIYKGSLSQTFTITKASNKIKGTASYTKVAKSATQSFKLDAKATGGKLKYKSDNKKVTVNSAGKVTIAKNFSGKAVITVTASNSNYKKATKKITITVKPAVVSLKSVKNNAKGKMKVAWSTLSYVSGYQVQYSTSSSFKSGNKTVTISGASNIGNTVSGLTKGKIYYVRVRAYKTIDGKKVYGAWSNVKNVKVSK